MDQRILGLVARGGAPGFAWLDGGGMARGWFSAWPDLEIESDDPAILDAVEAEWRHRRDALWVGWFTYDLGVDTLLQRPPRRLSLPGIALRRFPAALELTADGTALDRGDTSACVRLHTALAVADETVAPKWPLGPLRSELTAAEYRRRVARAREHVLAGDSYQVNLSQRFFAPWIGDFADTSTRVARAYRWLRDFTPAPMGALLQSGSRWIVSNSPETLVDVRERGDGHAIARSWPIKGTRPRGSDLADDAAIARALLESEKDRAEHVMIVDLVRNDLGHLAVPGSVMVGTSPELVTLPTVHHLVSEVRCQLRSDWRLREVYDALFPGGSVTGAPKRRTVEIIDELEGVPRGIYCGAVVALEPDGMRWSIPIRTGMLDDDGLVLHAGGGIVADSDPEAERVETWVKTRAFTPSEGATR